AGASARALRGRGSQDRGQRNHRRDGAGPRGLAGFGAGGGTGDGARDSVEGRPPDAGAGPPPGRCPGLASALRAPSRAEPGCRGSNSRGLYARRARPKRRAGRPRRRKRSRDARRRTGGGARGVRPRRDRAGGPRPCAHRRRAGGRGGRGGPSRPLEHALGPDRRGTSRPHGRGLGSRRDRLLPLPLLARDRRHGAAVPCGLREAEPLPRHRGHDPLRHAGRRHGRLRHRHARRRAAPGYRPRPRHPAHRAHPGGPRPDAHLLPPSGIPRPLQRPRHLGGGLGPRGGAWRGDALPRPQRRGDARGDRRQRLGLGLGGGRGGRAAPPRGPWHGGRGAARIRAPLRRQPCDARPHGELQIRPGPCPRSPGAAGAV
ncbi:MAG: FIG003603: membrane protein, putative, partial [uncultured Rubellimicrobium sp.]